MKFQRKLNIGVVIAGLLLSFNANASLVSHH